MSGLNRCVFYIANQHRYAIEAGQSARSLKETTPNVSAVLFVHGFSVTGGFDEIIELPDPPKTDNFYLKHCFWMTKAISLLMERGYEYGAFADCDTYFCGDVSEAFDLLIEFDLLGAHAPARKTTEREEKVSNSIFPEINIGFVPMYLDFGLTFWKDVYIQYQSHEELYGNNDQGAFGDVLWRHVEILGRIKFHTLPPEWNCRFNFPVFVAGEVKVLHGRNKDMPEVAKFINAEKGMRSWKSGEIASLISESTLTIGEPYPLSKGIGLSRSR